MLGRRVGQLLAQLLHAGLQLLVAELLTVEPVRRLGRGRRRGSAPDRALAAWCPDRAHAGTLGPQLNTGSGARAPTRPPPPSRHRCAGSIDRRRRALLSDARLFASDRRSTIARSDAASPHRTTNEPRINDRIRAREVRLVDPRREPARHQAPARGAAHRPGRSTSTWSRWPPQAEPAGLPDHGLRQVQVRGRAAGQGVAAQERPTSASRR